MKFSSGVNSADLQYPQWQEPYLEALIAPDIVTLQQRIAAAETAILRRLQAIAHSVEHRAERQAIEDALASLSVLKRESLGLPDRSVLRTEPRIGFQSGSQ